MSAESKKTSYWRRSVGVLLCAAPVLPPLSSLFSRVTLGRIHSISVAIVIMSVAILIGLTNLHLSFVRPLLFKRAHGSMNGYRNISGIPVVGSFLVLVAGLLGLGSPLCGMLGTFAMAIDTGGSLWILVYTWRDSSFWDR